MRIFLLRRRHLVALLGVVLVLAIFAVVNAPAAVIASASTRQLPIYCVDRSDNLVSISFDAAWGNEDTEELIDILTRYGVRATFFIVGDWVDKYPESVRALADSGMEVMNHSDDHAHFSQLSAAEIEAIKAAISEAVNKRLEVEGERTRTDKAAQEKNGAILDAEHNAARLEQKKLSAEMEERQLIDKLWDGYGLSHSAAEAVRKPIESPARANRRIAELRRDMGALGNPNLGAIDEYARVSERYEFLAAQRDDVEGAKAELLGIISEVTGQMKAIFTREFAAINESFAATFTELFGGGKAELVMEGEGDVLSCDIDIRVQPPGKALTTLTLLSGGEMAFVAIALYFAIIKIRPTPFCVMDEIEAALDEANVNRFASHMRRISGRTQFVVITHRRGTMEEADELYGVTMQEKGVSKVIELDLSEAGKHIDEVDS